eukprot:6457635-Amphidinium_carterae.1
MSSSLEGSPLGVKYEKTEPPAGIKDERVDELPPTSEPASHHDDEPDFGTDSESVAQQNTTGTREEGDEEDNARTPVGEIETQTLPR